MKTILSQIDFGNEAGDDVKPEELLSYFVEQDSFSKLVQPKGNLQVVHARKGVGKSALLNWIGYKVGVADPDAIVIHCRGADLVRSRFKLTSELVEPNEFIRDWMIRICAVINRAIAAKLRFAASDDHMTLVESAEIEGFKSRNIVGALLDRLQSMLERGGPEKQTVRDEIAMMKRVNKRRVWIIIDDLDATFQNTNQESLMMASFFSACRYLVRDVADLNVRVSIRTDVWALIRRYDESLDKMEQYVSELLWPRRDFLELLGKRVESSMLELGLVPPVPPAHVQKADAQERLLESVFVPKMPWTGYETDTYKVLYTLSYERPRWAIQLCKLSQEAALRLRANLISKEHIDSVWGEYGSKRIADLVAEHKHQCAQVEEVVLAFRGAPRLMPRDELFKWINNRISEHIMPNIEGARTKRPIDIARFLYRIGFILARSEASGGYEHYRFDQMPDFLSTRTENDFGLKWEIHPCYREALDIQKIDRSHRDRFGQMRRRN